MTLDLLELPTPQPRRRSVVAGGAALGLALVGAPGFARVLGAASEVAAPTPRFTEGPYYPPAFDAAPTGTLIRGPLAPQAMPLRLVGRVVDRHGQPVSGARVEIWQCDANRRYHHPAQGAEGIDPGFAGFGWQFTAPGGAYAFDTIRPVAYPGRTPHVHVRLRTGGREALTTQIFMPDEATANERDMLWRQLDGGRRPLALATLERADAGLAIAHFDIVLP